MKVFLYEYTCSGALPAGSLSAALRAEGRAMLAALLDDFDRVPGTETVTLLDEPGYPGAFRGRYRCVRSGHETEAFRELARSADLTLLIAPECDALLEARSRWVEEVGGQLLGSAPAAVRLTGDKLALARHLREHGIATPASRPFRPGERIAPSLFPLVCKPRSGAGSQATFLVPDAAQLAACPGRTRAEGWGGEILVQPWVPGLAASVAFLLGARAQLALLPAAQILSADGRFHYLGGTVPLPPGPAARATALARRAIETVPGLRGYVGVDLVLGSAADGSADQVIEINPRPTTSYVGLRALAVGNLAEALLQVAAGDKVPPLRWRPGWVRFQADGRIAYGPGSIANPDQPPL